LAAKSELVNLDSNYFTLQLERVKDINILLLKLFQSGHLEYHNYEEKLSIQDSLEVWDHKIKCIVDTFNVSGIVGVTYLVGMVERVARVPYIISLFKFLHLKSAL
jgi:hypothetical protein